MAMESVHWVRYDRVLRVCDCLVVLGDTYLVWWSDRSDTVCGVFGIAWVSSIRSYR